MKKEKNIFNWWAINAQKQGGALREFEFWLIGILLILSALLLFATGYFIGRRHALFQLGKTVEEESMSDIMYGQLCGSSQNQADGTDDLLTKEYTIINH